MLGKIIPQDQIDAFRSRLDQMINCSHELVQLSRRVDWGWIEKELEVDYSLIGRPSIPVRVMVGMLLLKQMENLSDEAVIRKWVENPYWQYFTGEMYFQHTAPFNPTDFVHFRKRIGETGMEKILALTVKMNEGSESEKEVFIDTTIQEKNITYPTDSKLAYKIIQYCWNYAESENIEVRQSYKRIVKALRLKLHHGDHPRRKKEAKKAKKKLLIIAGRLVRELRRKMSEEAIEYYGSSLDLFEEVLAQKRDTKDKRYSLHEVAVWCHTKGKAHKRYEFGNKIAIVRGRESGVIVGAKSFEGNPYDGHTLEATLEQTQRIMKYAGSDGPKIASTDRGFRGIKRVREVDILIPDSKNKARTVYEKQQQRKRFRKRAGIEPVIGHLKQDHGMDRNYLRGTLGNAVNGLLAASAFNMKKALNKIRAFFVFILMLTGMFKRLYSRKTTLTRRLNVFWSSEKLEKITQTAMCAPF